MSGSEKLNPIVIGKFKIYELLVFNKGLFGDYLHNKTTWMTNIEFNKYLSY